jgi:hypothetical protein
MMPEERIAEAVAAAQRDGFDQKAIATVLISWAARYALVIGWSPELVAGAQSSALELHLADRKELRRR